MQYKLKPARTLADDLQRVSTEYSKQPIYFDRSIAYFLIMMNAIRAAAAGKVLARTVRYTFGICGCNMQLTTYPSCILYAVLFKLRTLNDHIYTWNIDPIPLCGSLHGLITFSKFLVQLAPLFTDSLRQLHCRTSLNLRTAAVTVADKWYRSLSHYHISAAFSLILNAIRCNNSIQFL
jgi:hypothetical protein